MTIDFISLFVGVGVGMLVAGVAFAIWAVRVFYKDAGANGFPAPLPRHRAYKCDEHEEGIGDIPDWLKRQQE